MTLSIIIPVLNEEPLIGLAVRRAWALEPLEVLVVDGGSSDGACAAAEAAGAGLHVAPRGRGSQQNAGARAAAGDVLLFLHADAWLPPEAAAQIRAALTDPAVQAGAFQQRIEAEGWLFRLLEKGNAWRASRRGLPYGDQGIFMRRATFDRAGGFPETPLLEDVLLMKKVRLKTRPVLLPGPLHLDARRWRRRGVIRQTARNWAILSAARLGVSPQRLADFYR